MARVGLANHPDDATPADNLALFTDFLDRRSHLHDFTLQIVLSGRQKQFKPPLREQPRRRVVIWRDR